MKNQRIYNVVANWSFRAVVQQYAFKIGAPVFTLDEEYAALQNYIRYAIDLN